MWYAVSLQDPRNKYNKRDLLLNQSIFPLGYMKLHLQSLHKGSEADQYVFQNLKWSGVYLMSTLLNTLLQKVLTLVPLTATTPEVFVDTMTIFLSYSYDALEETLTHLKSLKIKNLSMGESYRLHIGRF